MGVRVNQIKSCNKMVGEWGPTIIGLDLKWPLGISVWGPGGAVLSLSLTLLGRRQLTDSDDADAHQSTSYLF